jgi:hypothetical protein
VVSVSSDGQTIRGPLSDEENAAAVADRATAVEIVLDIAHNPGAINALMRRVQRVYPTRPVRSVRRRFALVVWEYVLIQSFTLSIFFSEFFVVCLEIKTLGSA